VNWIPAGTTFDRHASVSASRSTDRGLGGLQVAQWLVCMFTRTASATTSRLPREGASYAHSPRPAYSILLSAAHGLFPINPLYIHGLVAHCTHFRVSNTCHSVKAVSYSTNLRFRCSARTSQCQQAQHLMTCVLPLQRSRSCFGSEAHVLGTCSQDWI
jgi:hypothetical protein